METKVSIVMPVYNGENYTDECLPSILDQSFRDYELIIIDDGSTDRTVEKIRSYADSRIRLIPNRHNFIDSLNKGLALARGKYIARMDIDDIMLPGRLEKQYRLMEERPEVTVCSGWYIFFGQMDMHITPLPGIFPDPLLHLLHGPIVSHSSVMMRKSFLQTHQIRYQDYPYAEDYKLWFEIAKQGGIFYILPEDLTMYRLSSGQVSQKKAVEQNRTHYRITKEVINYLVRHNSTSPEKIKELHKITGYLNEMHYLPDETFVLLFTELLKHPSIKFYP